MGGVSDSLFSGGGDSHAAMVGLDVHTKPGLLLANQKMAKDSGSTVTELCLYSLACSNGDTYWFSYTTGKIWKRTSAGTWSLVHTSAPTTGGFGCLGAYEYEGWIYWATENHLHRIQVALLSDWTTNVVENWATFTNGNATHHPMHEVNGVLYIGDGNLVAQVSQDLTDNPAGTISSAGVDVTGTGTNFDPLITVGDKIRFTDANGQTQVRTVVTRSSDTALTTDTAFSPVAVDDLFKFSHHNFSGEALDLPEEYAVTCLTNIANDLLIGTKVSNVATARVFRWDTWSVSWVDDTSVVESGVNAFLMLNESVLVSCGTQGNIYVYNGQLQPHKKVPGAYSPTATSKVNPQSSINRGTSLLIGFSNLSGNPSKHAVWQYGRYSFAYPLVLTTDYPISTGSLSSVEIGAMLMIGDNVFVAWKDSSGESPTYGVDKIDYSTKFNGAYLETMVLAYDREEIKNWASIMLNLASALPESCNASVQYKLQSDTAWSDAAELVEKIDAVQNSFVMDEGVQGNTLQLKLTLTTSSNATPEVHSLVITEA